MWGQPQHPDDVECPCLYSTVNGQKNAGKGPTKARNDLRPYKKWLLVLVWWVQINTLPKTNIAPEIGHPIPGIFIFQPSVFRCYVSCRECTDENVVSTNTHENWLFVVPGWKQWKGWRAGYVVGVVGEIFTIRTSCHINVNIISISIYPHSYQYRYQYHDTCHIRSYHNSNNSISYRMVSYHVMSYHIHIRASV